MQLPRSAGRLTGAELAEAAVLGDLAVALLFLGWMLPVGQVLEVLSVVPQAALAYRRRPRVVAASAVASSSVAFLLGGVNLWSIAIVVAAMGAIAGTAARRGWGRLRLLGLGLLVWAAVSGVTVGQLALFAGFRKLALAQIRNSWKGVKRIGSFFDRWLPGLQSVLRWGDHAVNWTVQHWYLVIPAGELLLVEGVLLLAARVARPTLRSLERALGTPPRPVRPARRPPDAASAPGEAATRGPGAGEAPVPVPITFSHVSYRYPGADGYALEGVDLEVPGGTYVAVVGRNGSGKSTLARVAAGMLEVEGELGRPGAAGLGRPGGTAVVFQRPESQVLGTRVRDDLVWGMDPGTAAMVDVPGVLARVGLEGMEEAETATLSGGQLQRLAIASALARHPRLLVSDESTSMLDPASRRQVAELLASLPAKDGMTVLHVTHRDEEAAAATMRVEVDQGRVRRR